MSVPTAAPSRLDADLGGPRGWTQTSAFTATPPAFLPHGGPQKRSCPANHAKPGGRSQLTWGVRGWLRGPGSQGVRSPLRPSAGSDATDYPGACGHQPDPQVHLST